jgi:nicotinamide-nucleotide amidase
LGLDLVLDEKILESIRKRFARRDLEMPQVNRQQALVHRGAEVLTNPAGTAPGLWIRTSTANPGNVPVSKNVVLLPGPPRELVSVFETRVLPQLVDHGRGAVYRTKRVLVAGLAESSVEQKVGVICREHRNPRTTILASAGQVEIRLTARGNSPAEAEEAIESLATRLREILGHHIFSELGEKLEDVLGRMLRRRTLTLAVAESCTGGLITHRLTESPGSSDYLERGLVTYSNRSKIDELGVPEDLLLRFGAVSDEVGRAMAKGVRERAGTDLGLAVTGIAGPGGGSDEKPVGLVFIALSDREGERVRRFNLPGGRSEVKWWTSQLALNLVRMRLLEEPLNPVISP